MHTSMSSDPFQRERESLLKQSIVSMRRNGSQVFAVKGLPGCREPEEVAIPGLNVQMRPDILATAPEGDGPRLAVVVISNDLVEESCGRRWQMFDAWAKKHQGQLYVFVHPEDVERAASIARHWHVDPKKVVPVP